GQVVTQRRTLVMDDVQASADWQHSADIPETKAIRAWIGAPLVAKDQVMGQLGVDSHQVGAYSEEDGQLVAAFAEQAAVAVLNAGLYADSERRSYGLRALAATAQAINGAYDLDEVLRLVTQHAAIALGMEAASLALIQNGRLVFKQAVGPRGDSVLGLSIALGP